MTEIIMAVTGVLFMSLITWSAISAITYNSGFNSQYDPFLNEPRTKTNWNLIALIKNVNEYGFKSVMPKRKTKLDREIEDEEKEIAELEKQKERIKKLYELKKRKEKLFKEVNGDE